MARVSPKVQWRIESSSFQRVTPCVVVLGTLHTGQFFGTMPHVCFPQLPPMGQTRSRVTDQYALLTPDTFVTAPLVGWQHASAAVHIAPEMGARFTQYTATLEAEACSALPGGGVSRFFYVLEGSVTLQGMASDAACDLTAGQYAYLPPDAPHEIITGSATARLAVFEKKHQAQRDHVPDLVTGNASDAPGDVFMGDADLYLQNLLPASPAYDMAMNVFTYQSGARLPQVEVHVMEHGLLMLQGEGIYRLGDDWFPVQAGDVIWMASYCPQWFVAMGKQPAKYLYYKDVHRDRLTEK